MCHHIENAVRQNLVYAHVPSHFKRSLRNKCVFTAHVNGDNTAYICRSIKFQHTNSPKHYHQNSWVEEAGRSQSVKWLATGWTVWGFETPVGSDIFPTSPDRPWGYSASNKMGKMSLPRGLNARCVALPTHLAPRVKEGRAIPLFLLRAFMAYYLLPYLIPYLITYFLT
jgi:hypothetical protein